VVAELQPVVPRAGAAGRVLDLREHDRADAGLLGLHDEGEHRVERLEAVVDDPRHLLVPGAGRVRPHDVGVAGVQGRLLRRAERAVLPRALRLQPAVERPRLVLGQHRRAQRGAAEHGERGERGGAEQQRGGTRRHRDGAVFPASSALHEQLRRDQLS
jgi:hypothetical protein